MKQDIYNYDLRLERGLERGLKSVKNSSLSDKNKELILKFYDDCALDGIGKPRLIRLLEGVRSLGLVLGKDYDIATVDDVKKMVRHIDSKKWSIWTKATYKKLLKQFFKWLKVENGEYPKEVKWLRANPKPTEIPRLSQADLITPDELKFC